MTTYNQIIKAFEYFASQHKQLNTFHCGKLFEFETKSNLYPAMIVLPQPSIVTERSIRLTFNVFIMDLLNRDLSNEDEIHSDSLSVILDFFKYLETGSDLFTITNDNKSTEFFTETGPDILAGCQGSFTIEYPFVGHCDIPFTVIETEPEPVRMITFDYQGPREILVDEIEQNEEILFKMKNPVIFEDTFIPIYYTCTNDCVYYQGSPITSGTPVLFYKDLKEGGLNVNLQVLRDGSLIDFNIRIRYKFIIT